MKSRHEIMTLEEVIEALSGMRYVFVTGPQRAGTMIASRILAEQLNLPFIPEEEIHIDDLASYQRLRGDRAGFVIQAPGLCYAADRVEADCVVLMRRDVADVVASEKRINWKYEGMELAKYRVAKGPIAAVKYAHWERYQRASTASYVELDYKSLQQSRWWVDKDRRRHFHEKQTQEGEEQDPPWWWD